MSDVRNYLMTIDGDKQAAARIAVASAIKLEAKQVTLIEIVQSLGEYINDEDAKVRSKAVQYLSLVIGDLSPTFLSRQQIQVLCQFLCDRIEDGGAVGGLSKLQNLGRFNKDMATMTFRAMVEHFQDLQIRPQSQRMPILELLHSLMSNHRSALKSLGNESLIGITDLVSGEKDPRNLMIIFSILKAVMVEWDITAHAETLFDSVFCYFPITFRPPPDDPYGITAQDLKTRLRECISASSKFAPYAIPQLIDKLDSTSPNVKKDVLQAIGSCSSSYGVVTVSNYSITLWDSLKYEILNVQEEDLAEEALVALRNIAVTLSHGLTSIEPKTPLEQYLKPILKECNECLQTPQHKQAKPAGDILKTLGTASTFALSLIVKATVPSLLTLYQDADSIVKQRALIEFMVQILESANTNYGAMATVATAVQPENPLQGFKDRLFELCSQTLMSAAQEEISLRVVAIRCLVLVCTLRKFLQDNEIGMAVQNLDDIILLEDHSGRDDLKNEAIQALITISRIKSSLIMDITFPAFIARLPDSTPLDGSDYLTILEGLARISVEKVISNMLIRRLLTRLDVVLTHTGTGEYCRAILSTLHYVLSQRELVSDPNLGFYYEKIVVGLSSQVALSTAGKDGQTALIQEATLETLGRLSALIIRALDPHERQSAAAQVYTLFTADGDFTPVPFSKDIQNSQRATMILSTYLLAGLGQRTKLPYADVIGTGSSKLLGELTRLAIEEERPLTRRYMLRQVALVANKFMAQADLHHATNLLWAPLTGLLDRGILCESRLRVAFWIAKGLIYRLASTAEVLTPLLDLLPDISYGNAAALGFGLLLAPDEILSKENGVTIRLLVKQKVFNICVPAIATSFRTADQTTKSHYLIALSGIIRHASTEILMSEIEVLLPLLLQSLDLEYQDVKAATIETVTVIIEESPRVVEGHVSSLVSHLLGAATGVKINTPEVRFKALRCLRAFPGKVKQSTLQPYKIPAVRGMVMALDDPKRDVRKEAVDCRAAWLNLDEPDEED